MLTVSSLSFAAQLGTPNEDFGGPGIGEGGLGEPFENNESLGKVLIISENGDASSPDDNAFGGVFTFDFASPLDIKTIGLLDHEEGVMVEAYSVASENPIFTAVAEASNNGVETLDLDVPSVIQLILTFYGSGAVSDLTLACPPLQCESNPDKIVMFRVKNDGKCEEKCVKPSDDDIAKTQDKGYSFCPCEFPVLPELDPSCLPLQCPSNPEKIAMFRVKNDGICDEKCVKPNKIVESQEKDYVFCPCEAFPSTNDGMDSCDLCDGKPKYLAFSYNAVSCVASNCNLQAGKFEIVEEGGLAGSETVQWIASDDEQCENGNAYGTGFVNSGDSFGFSTDDKFASNIFLCLFGVNGKQIISFHASCSVPIVQGDKFGHLTLNGFNTVPPSVDGGDAPCGF